MEAVAWWWGCNFCVGLKRVCVSAPIRLRTIWASLTPLSFLSLKQVVWERTGVPTFSFPICTNHYLFPSIPNVHAASVQTTGMVLQAYFPDGSHLLAFPLLSLAHLWDDSQHISLAAICLSAFTAKQTSEQPNSLMGGGLETSPARLAAPLYLPLLLLIPPLHLALSTITLYSLLCFNFCVIISDAVLVSLVPHFLLPTLDPAGRVQPYIRLFLRGSEQCACRPWWQKEQQSLTWTYAVRSPIYNSFS